MEISQRIDRAIIERYSGYMDTLLQMRKSCDIAMLFKFNVDMDIETNNEMYLILEKAEEFEIFVNGTRITY